jgi:hypothetical protein
MTFEQYVSEFNTMSIAAFSAEEEGDIESSTSLAKKAYSVFKELEEKNYFHETNKPSTYADDIECDMLAVIFCFQNRGIL